VQRSAEEDNFAAMLAFASHASKSCFERVKRPPRLDVAYGNPASWRLQTLLHTITFLALAVLDQSRSIAGR
jgi:hypothetical protein